MFSCFSKKATLTGVATDDVSGITLANVMVAIDGNVMAITDNLGQYTIKNIKPGDYTVKYTKTDYAPVIK